MTSLILYYDVINLYYDVTNLINLYCAVTNLHYGVTKFYYDVTNVLQVNVLAFYCDFNGLYYLLFCWQPRI